MTFFPSFLKHLLILIVCGLCIMPLAAQDAAADAYAEALRRIEEAAANESGRLDLRGLGLETLPPEIGQLTNVEFLLLSDNHLTTLPPEIGQLSKLWALNLASNRLTTLPDELWQLTRLSILELGSNQLTTLPAEIGQLTNIKFLTLSDNQLTTLPLEIGQLSIYQAGFERNPLTFPPPDVQAQGPGAVLAYLRDYNSTQIRQVIIVIAVIAGVIMLVLAFRRQHKKKHL
jgi:Leucine-rich repeat (LRR) protein